ncbi:MAG: hypothetical protein ACXVA9_05045 [Bdellovibrionales bacterium]
MIKITVLIFSLFSTAVMAESEDLNTVLKNAKMKDGQIQTGKGMQKLGFKKMGPVTTNREESANGVTDARCVPSIKSGSQGEVEGFRCLTVGAGSTLHQAGIVDGDIVLALDGEKIVRPESMMNLYQKIKSNQYSEIVIRRNGQEETLRR